MKITKIRTFSLRSSAIALAFGLACAAPLAHADALSDAQAMLKQGQLQGALEKVDQHLAGKPKDAQGRFIKGLILTELNRQAEAVTVFTKLTEDYPELPEPYNNLAVIYAQQKQYEKAKTALEMAIRTHPSYATAHENLGDIYARLASQAYDKALQLDTNNTTAQNKLAMMRDLMTLAGRQAPPARPTAVAAAPVPATPATPAAPTAKPASPVPPVALNTPPTPAKPEAKPAEAKPEPKKPETKPEPKADDGAGEVQKTVERWAKDWSSKDARAYLGHYAGEFQTPNGESRTSWEKERTARVTKPGNIEVDVSDVKVSVDGDKATAKFRQRYRSANLNVTSSKTLVLVRKAGKWQIQQERTGG